MTRINIVASLVAVTACMRLAFVSEMDENFTKSDEIRDDFLDSHSDGCHLGQGSTLLLGNSRGDGGGHHNISLGAE